MRSGKSCSWTHFPPVGSAWTLKGSLVTDILQEQKMTAQTAILTTIKLNKKVRKTLPYRTFLLLASSPKPLETKPRHLPFKLESQKPFSYRSLHQNKLPFTLFQGLHFNTCFLHILCSSSIQLHL